MIVGHTRCRESIAHVVDKCKWISVHNERKGKSMREASRKEFVVWKVEGEKGRSRKRSPRPLKSSTIEIWILEITICDLSAPSRRRVTPRRRSSMRGCEWWCERLVVLMQ